jgi:CRISPR-associated endonuclease/helicase Cas3
MSELDFAAFFHDVHGVPPLPWQARLAAHLMEHGEWPEVIDLPTASGKTACIDIALFHLAYCAHQRIPWKAARRIVFVVDRRIIVDAAAERADRIRVALEERQSKAVRSVADALLKLGGSHPLRCQRLRGGMPREPRVTPNPAQPLIITSTVDQIGSRLLFRGYGLSPYAHPVYAGLLSHDTLVLLDEAHLGEPFRATISAIAREQGRAAEPLDTVRPIRIACMSATSRSSSERFRLDAADLAHPLIAARRSAPKPTRLVECAPKPAERIKTLCREALTVFGQLETKAPILAVIVNRVSTARAVFETLRDEAKARNFDMELMIGRSRPLDRDNVSKRLMARARANPERQPGDQALVVVATQTIEVGADLDFDGMVTECASLDALMQRFGRLDRLGKFRKARAAIVGGGEGEDPVYGMALPATWEWLNAVAARESEQPTLDFSIESIETLLKDVSVTGLTGKPRDTLELAPTFVDLLCQTYPMPMCQPDVAALLHGAECAPPDVQIVWRADLPTREIGRQIVLDQDNAGACRDLLELNPPSSLEALSLPIYATQAWLESARREYFLADMEGSAQDEEQPEGKASGFRRFVWRRGEDGWQPVPPRAIRPGDTIVVPARYGGCDEYGFAPDSQKPVLDLSSRAREQLKQSPLLVVTKASLQSLQPEGDPNGIGLWGQLHAAYRDGSAPQELLSLALESLGERLSAEHPWLTKEISVDVIDCAPDTAEPNLFALVISADRVCQGDISDEDLSSSQTVPVPLDEHNAGVGERARFLAAAVGLNERHIRTLERAGRLHDLGKADPRFQGLLRGGDYTTFEGRLLAKGLRRIRAGRSEPNERHEAYSVAFLKKHPELLSSAPDPELALYLIGTHHGRGRALMPDCHDEGTVLKLDVEGATYAFEGAPRLGAIGSDWAQLFWKLNRRYGPWGLAYLEAVLRCADQLRSEDELQRTTRA